MTISDALAALLPGAQWVLNGDLSTLVIMTPNVKPPTQDQVDAWIKANSYVQQRAAAYPPIGDQLDAIWQWCATNPAGLPAPVLAMLSKIQAVKTQYPAPAPATKSS